MPNHVVNVLKIHASPERTREITDAIKGSEDEKVIDFNKIIPMPKELQGITADGLIMYLDNRFMCKDPISHLLEDVKRTTPETLENFCNGLKCLNTYGFGSWYSWALAKWGTKWNAYSQKVLAPNAIEFDTAWSSPEPIFQALSARWPDVRFEILYADEDIGNNVGHYCLEQEEETPIEIKNPKRFALKMNDMEEADYDSCS